jgi:hypothetical protein
MNRSTLFTAALLAMVETTTPSAAQGIAMPASCVQVAGIEALLATSRLARIHSKARNYSTRLTHQFELSSAAPFSWRLADGGGWRDAAASAVCTRCEAETGGSP